MKISFKKGWISLILGDIFLLFISLWIAVILRYHTLPSAEYYGTILAPFSFVFALWILVFFIAGLYDRSKMFFVHKATGTLFHASIASVFLSVAFFYFLQSAVAPKTILFLFSAISFILILVWRVYGYRVALNVKPQTALVVGRGKELKEIVAYGASGRYGFTCADYIDLDQLGSMDEKSIEKMLKDKIQEEGITLVILDMHDTQASELMAHFYELLFSRVTFARLERVYEELFLRIPLSSLGYHWFLDNISFVKKKSYDIGKRIMDILIASVLLIPALIAWPFVALAIRWDDNGPVFIFQDRVGKGGDIIRIPKFRSMKANDSGKWVTENDSRITRVGKFLRKSRIDELPQLWSVLKGDLSLIGPRPDIVGLGIQLEKDIPYYAIRNTVTPGLSGWAQIMQDIPPQSLEETKMRLSYDFYYIKHRSLLLDLHIALRTIRTLVSRLGV